MNKLRLGILAFVGLFLSVEIADAKNVRERKTGDPSHYATVEFGILSKDSNITEATVLDFYSDADIFHIIFKNQTKNGPCLRVEVGTKRQHFKNPQNQNGPEIDHVPGDHTAYPPVPVYKKQRITVTPVECKYDGPPTKDPVSFKYKFLAAKAVIESKKRPKGRSK